MAQLRPTRTKIVATLGPASDSPDAIRALIKAGVDVFRLNFSHGTHGTHGNSIRSVRDAERELGVHVAVMQDLSGPRIRTGKLIGGRPVELRAGEYVVLRAGDFAGDGKTIAVTYERLASDVGPGDCIMLCDGLIELEVVETDGSEAKCRVEFGGTLGENKGINLPDVDLTISAPTDKDLADLRFGLEHGVDYVALSFVRSADDVRRLKEEMVAIAGEDAGVPVVAKIEKPEALANLAGILEAADAVMVARGDLGIEMYTEEVPAAQKSIIRQANRCGVPAITATQMLESMVNSPRPTRAEASDVANAILDGTDAVMLSAETSIGSYPVEAVSVMDRIARRTERLRHTYSAPAPEIATVRNAQEHALASAACAVAEELDAIGIVPFTMTGSTARYVSQRRPDTRIFALTPCERTCRALKLFWGVHPIKFDQFETTDEMVRRGEERLRELGIAGPGDTVIYVAGANTNTPGGTDVLKIHRFS